MYLSKDFSPKLIVFEDLLSWLLGIIILFWPFFLYRKIIKIFRVAKNGEIHLFDKSSNLYSSNNSTITTLDRILLLEIKSIYDPDGGDIIVGYKFRINYFDNEGTHTIKLFNIENEDKIDNLVNSITNFLSVKTNFSSNGG